MSDMIDLVRQSAAMVGGHQQSLARARALRYSELGYDPAIWQTMCEMGWAAMRRVEAGGEPSFGMAEYCALVEELGAALAPEPVIVANAAVACLPAEEAMRIASGEARATFVWNDDAAPFIAAGGRIRGKGVAPSAAGCDWIVVPLGDRVGLVAADAENLSLVVHQTQDGCNFGIVAMTDTPAAIFSIDPARASDEAALAAAAYLLGAADRCFRMTLEYLRTRHQFGGPIGRFQALRHRAVDLSIQLELARASVEGGARALDAGVDGDGRRAVVSRAKARASDMALLLTRQSIQLHGAIGYTDEADPGLFLRKAMTLAAQFGDARFHRRRFGAIRRGHAHVG